MEHRYRFTAPVWIWQESGDATWHFVTVPEEDADEIKAISEGIPRRGFGSVRVEATLGPSTWRTSIFPGQDAYVLPLKKAVRAKAGVEEGDDVDVEITLLLEE